MPWLILHNHVPSLCIMCCHTVSRVLNDGKTAVPSIDKITNNDVIINKIYGYRSISNLSDVKNSNDSDVIWSHRALYSSVRGGGVVMLNTDVLSSPWCSRRMLITILEHSMVDITSLKAGGLVLSLLSNMCRDVESVALFQGILKRFVSRLSLPSKSIGHLLTYALYSLPCTPVRDELVSMGASVSRAITLSGDDVAFVASGLGDIDHLRHLLIERQITHGVVLSDRSQLVNQSLVSVGHTMLHCAICSDDADIVQRMLDIGCVFDNDPLSFACKHNCCNSIRAICNSKNDDVSLTKGCPLGLCRSSEAVKLLLSHGVPIISRSHCALHTAVLTSVSSVVFELVNAMKIRNIPIDTVENGCTSLHVACRRGSADVVQVLLRAGADPTRADGADSTPLSIAIDNGHVDVVNLLLSHGVRPNSRLLFNCIAVNSAELVKILLAFGADPNVSIGKFGDTALHKAAETGSIDIVQLLIAYRGKAKVNAKNVNKQTPLHAACITGNLDVIKLLIERGADVRAVDLKLRKPIDVAKEHGHDDVVRYLNM